MLDASVALSWCLPGEESESSTAVLHGVKGVGAAVPGLWFLEVCHVLLTAERRSRIAPADLHQSLRLLGALPINLVPDASGFVHVEATLALARQCSLSLYDATYLELAVRQSLPLASADRALRAAALRVGVGTYDG